jgi:phosphatidylinositol glycan class B
MAYKIAYGDQVDILVTWEWLKYYALRSVLWPLYLSLPLHLLRFLNIDFNRLVILSPIFMNTIIVVLGDYYSYKLTKRLINRKCALIFLLNSLIDKDINLIFLRTMTNGIEAVLSIIAIYYYSKLKYY